MKNDSEPIPNLPLLRKVLDFISEQPERHDQALWGYEGLAPGEECGTAMCVAGWAMYFAGRPLRREHGWGYGMEEAAELLGLTTGEAEELFIHTCTPMRYGLDVTDRLGAVRLIAERIAARAGEVL